MAAIHAYFYTDPACPWSWAMEPALRRMEVEFGDAVELRLVMGGLAREFGAPLEVVGDWLAAAEAGGMPVDPRLWLESPPRSSYPACLAVKAAGEQGGEAQRRYLRTLRRGFACERRRLDHADALLDAARETGGLDLERLRVDLGSHAILEAFGADLDRAGEAGARAEGEGRVRLPSLEFVAPDGAVHGAYGRQPAERLREAALAAGAEPGGEPPPGVEEALRRFGPLAAAEVAAVCDLPGPRASAELWRLAGEWRARFERRLTAELWFAA